MKLSSVLGCWIACCIIATPAYSAEPFTKEQREEIARLLEAERSRVITEVARELSAQGIRLDTAPVLNRAQSAAASESKTAELAIEATSTDDARHVSTLDAINPLGAAPGVVPPNRGARNDDSVIQIDTSNKGTEATLSVSTPEIIDFKNGRFRRTHWNVTASAPLSDDGYGTFADLDGLTSGFGVKAEWTRTSVPFDKISPKAANAICKLVLGLDQLDRCSAQDPFQLLPGFKESNLTEAQRISLGKALEDLRKAPRAATVSSFGFGLDHDEFKYLTLPNEKHTDSKIGWNVTGSYGVVTASRKHYWGGGFTYSHGYKPVDLRVVCTPDGEPTFDCINARFAPPKDEIRRTVYAEMRSAAFDKPYSVRISHDLANDHSAVDVPIYLIAAKDKGFTGGLRFGWETEEKFTAGIFVGAAFDVWP